MSRHFAANAWSFEAFFPLRVGVQQMLTVVPRVRSQNQQLSPSPGVMQVIFRPLRGTENDSEDGRTFQKKRIYLEALAAFQT